MCLYTMMTNCEKKENEVFQQQIIHRSLLHKTRLGSHASRILIFHVIEFKTAFCDESSMANEASVKMLVYNICMSMLLLKS